jgi:hypothetical protein
MTVLMKDYSYLSGVVIILGFVTRFVVSALCELGILDGDGKRVHWLFWLSSFGVIFSCWVWLLLAGLLRALGILKGTLTGY